MHKIYIFCFLNVFLKIYFKMFGKRRIIKKFFISNADKLVLLD